MTLPRVMLVAHHANPAWGGEPLIGWRWAQGLADRTDVTLVTHVRNRAAIEADGSFGGVVHYVDTERLARTINRINDRIWRSTTVVNRALLEFASLRMFDRAACRIARRLARADAVDIIHRVSPISPRAPTRLGTCGLPFVLGPVNGGMRLPPGFEAVARHERAGLHRLRSLARLADPWGLSFATADRIVAATRTTVSVVPRRHHARTSVLSENAVDLGAFQPVYEKQGTALRVLYLGRLIPCKGVRYLIEAVALLRSRNVDVCLEIVGDGEDRRRLEAAAREGGAASAIRFRGAVAVEEVPSHLARYDVLCLPSVRESGGAVLLEAMAAGKPVVAIDHGGPSETVSPACGIVVPPVPDDRLSERLALALATLAHDEPARERMGRAARRHVEEQYTWKGKVEVLLAMYQDVLAGRPSGSAQQVSSEALSTQLVSA